MTPERFQLVLDLFDRLCDLPAGERQAFYLAQSTPDEVRAEVESLILHQGKSGSDDSILPRKPDLQALAQDKPLFAEGELVAGLFRIEARIGRGGMGEVYRATNSGGERLALKVMDAHLQGDETALRRFRREVEAARKITHPNVCRVYELFVHQWPDGGQTALFSMEYLEGESLSQTLRRRGALPLREVGGIAEGILAGLGAAHASGVLHRDLKPSNVMLTRDGRAILLDFGLARVVAPRDQPKETSLTATGQIMGALAYLAPEQLKHEEPDERTDLYGAGLILFELLAGRRPFASDSEPSAAAAVERILRRPPSLASLGVAVPRHWSEAIRACLEADRPDRPRSAAELASMLRGETRVVPGWLRRKVRRRVLVAAAGVGVAGAAGWGWREARKSAFARGVKVIVAQAADSAGPEAVSWQLRRILQQSQYLTVWDHAGLQEAWTRLGRQGTPQPAAEDWRSIAFREGAPLLVFATLGERELAVRAEQIQGSPDRPWAQWSNRFPVESDAAVVDAIGRACRWIRDVAGESAGDIASNSGLEAVTTPSWQALKEFTRGEQLALNPADREPAIAAFESASRIDPDFTMAWMRIGDLQMARGREREGFAAWLRALESSRKRPLTRREDLRFRGMLATDTSEWDEAASVFGEYARHFSGDWIGPFYRAFPLLMAGRVRESDEELRKCLKFPGSERFAMLQLAWGAMYREDVPDAEHWIAELSRKHQAAFAAEAGTTLHYLRGDTTKALASLDDAGTAGPMTPPRKSVCRVLILADGGHLPQALQEADLRGGVALTAAESEVIRVTLAISRAFLLEETGERGRALRTIADLDERAMGPEHLAQAGTFLARRGSADRAEKMLTAIPGDLPVPKFQIPRLRLTGEIALARNRVEEGLNSLRAAAALDSKAMGQEYLARGLARAGDLAGARREAERSLRHKSLQLRMIIPEPAGTWRRTRKWISEIS